MYTKRALHSPRQWYFFLFILLCVCEYSIYVEILVYISKTRATIIFPLPNQNQDESVPNIW